MADINAAIKEVENLKVQVKENTEIVNKANAKIGKIVDSQIANLDMSIKTTNLNLKSVDVSAAFQSLSNLNTVSFDGLIGRIENLKNTVKSFKSVVTGTFNETKAAIEEFSQTDASNASAEDIRVNASFEVSDATAQNVQSSAQSIGDAFTAAGAGVSQASGGMASAFSSLGQGAMSFGKGVATAAGSVSGMIDSVTNLFAGFQALGAGMIAAATGVALLIPLLPALGTSILTMAVNMSGVLAYLPELLVFSGVLLVLSLMGEGLLAAGNGLLNIGAGLTSMTEGMAALLAFMPIFIAGLSGITDNVGGIILFVLLAASMLVMAIAMQTMNEQLAAFVAGMTALAGLMSVGFVAAFAVFAVTLIGMSFFMDKAAKGIQKITDAMTKQCAKLAILNPLLAAQAILTNPFVGVATVALAVAGGLLVKALLPAMATGGVVSEPTVAMVGEGRYPEAVVPLGDSPQFSSMKTDIANAVLSAMNASGAGQSGTRPIELTVNLDGKVLAKQIYAPLQLEAERRGY